MQFSLSDKHIVVNYHYVEDPRADFSGIKPTSIETFKRQIEFLSKHYSFTNIPNIYDAAKSGSSDRLCAITFDDGLMDQYTYAMPVLNTYSATATFFIIAGVLDGYFPSAHMVHLLLSNRTAEELVDLCNEYFRLSQPQDQSILIPKDRRITTERKLRDDVVTANFKETINRLSVNTEKSCLDYLIDKTGIDKEPTVKEIFMDERTIKELSLKKYSIECHGYHHLALDMVNEEVVRKDIREAKKKLEKIVDRPITILSYPHGGYNETIRKISEEEGFDYGVTILQQGLEKDTNPFAIPRYDTNDVQIDL